MVLAGLSCAALAFGQGLGAPEPAPLAERIPYFAFRGFLPGSATGPHIHIGPPSERTSRGG
jgi:hypothetical protein